MEAVSPERSAPTDHTAGGGAKAAEGGREEANSWHGCSMHRVNGVDVDAGEVKGREGVVPAHGLESRTEPVGDDSHALTLTAAQLVGRLGAGGFGAGDGATNGGGSHVSGSLAVALAALAQEGPIDGRAQALALDAGPALDLDGVPCGDRAATGKPLVHKGRIDPEESRQSGLPTNDLTGGDNARHL